MADNAEETEQADVPTTRQLTAARNFVAAHGKQARGVIEPVGRIGARVVLVGADGAMGDVMVSSVQAGEALIELVDDLDTAEWDSDTVAAAAIGAAHRRKMGGSLTRG